MGYKEGRRRGGVYLKRETINNIKTNKKGEIVSESDKKKVIIMRQIYG